MLWFCLEGDAVRIGVDIDGVMYQWSKTARYMLREILPDSPYTKAGPMGQEATSWDYISSNVAPKHWKWLWVEGVRLGLFRYGHLYPGTIKAIRELAELGEVIVITHRPQQAVNDTLAWLSYQNLPLAGVHILTDQAPKSTVRPQCDAYIDDKMENCHDLAKNTNARLVALMDRTWNQTDEGRAVTRVRSWREFINLVEKL